MATVVGTVHGAGLPAIPGADRGEVEYARTMGGWLAAGEQGASSRGAVPAR